MRIRYAILAAAVAAVLTACSSALSGTPVPGETDIRALDTGSYPIEPLNAHDDDPVLPFYEMYEVAALRLADYVISPGDISSELIYGTSAATAWRSVVPSWLGRGAGDIAVRHKLLYGFEVGGASIDKSITSFDWPSKDPSNKFTGNTVVLQFPDSQRATAAAEELYDADFGLQEGRNQPVTLPAHPNARAHWRPDSPFLRTFMPHGSYVIGLLLSVPTPDRTALTTLAESAYTKQIEALSRTTPLTEEEVITLPWDADHLLMRTLNPDQSTKPDSVGTGYLRTGKPGALHYAAGRLLPRDRAYVDKQLTAMNAEQIAIAAGTIVIRTPDPESADRAVSEKLFPWQVRLGADPAPKVPDTTCVENRPTDSVKRFSCLLAYNEYVGIVSSSQLLDAHQRAAAQYAIFANTR
ncbi:hypothetical protein [Nocardia sp. A7]|uniref:DUF7373 family lipoprotein n=1 Tax=Nocardia sp. A7 TaxID=2789274 RepID=UPI00397D7159